MRVIIVHDFMETYGGAERVTQEMARTFPDAPVYAILGRQRVARRMGVGDRFTSLLPPRERLLRHYRLGAPVLPLVVDAHPLPEADVLLTSSYAFALRFRTRNRAPQVCYCHSPLRFAWSMTAEYRDKHAGGVAAGAAFGLMAQVMRRSDLAASRRVARFLTGSEHQAGQIRQFYGRPADVIGAPIDGDLFRPLANGGGPEDYFLLCARLVEPYKRVAHAIEAFRRLPEQLVVAGDGPARAVLEASAPSNVTFTGGLEDHQLIPLMQHCRAALFPSRDDFGLLPLEVMACGRPVLAFAGGGAVHTMTPGVTGQLFEQQTAEGIRRAVERFDASAYDPSRLRKHALRWEARAFRRRLVDAVVATAR